jgi:hypothetical protein
MSQKSNVQVSVTLSEGSWRAIMDILRITCQLRGNDWVQWQQSVTQTIQTAVDKAKQPSSSQQRAGPSRRSYEYDYDYEDDGSDELGAILWAAENNEYFYDEDGEPYPATDLL